MLSYAYPPRSQQHLSNRCAQQKYVTQIQYCWGQTAAKRECGHVGQRTSSKKSSATLTAVGLSDRKVYSRTTTKLIPLLQPEQGFFPKDGPESFQVPDWYPNVKMVVVPVCLHVSCFDVGCCSSECMRVVSH